MQNARTKRYGFLSDLAKQIESEYDRDAEHYTVMFGLGEKRDFVNWFDEVFERSAAPLSYDPFCSYRLCHQDGIAGYLRIPRDGDQRSELMSITIPK